MSIANNYYDFKREIELIIKQNPLECELYSIVATIIRERDSSKNISLRDVSRITEQSDVINSKDRKYMTDEGNNGSSDFLVINTDYLYSQRNTNLILGCIEVKAIYLELDKGIEQKKEQFKGELKTFGKLIYTNGIEWRLYEYDSDLETQNLLWKITLGKYVHGKQSVDLKVSDTDYIEWNEVSEWYKLLNEIDKIKWDKNDK
jgi:hypothetical protein